jgi:hypothetical protein
MLRKEKEKSAEIQVPAKIPLSKPDSEATKAIASRVRFLSFFLH